MDHGAGPFPRRKCMRKGQTIDTMRSAIGPAMYPGCWLRLGRRSCRRVRSAAAPRLPTLLVRAVRRHARVTDACESAAPGSPLRILLEARIRACPGMDTTTFGASRHISFEHGALELIWTQNDTCRYVSSGYRALDHDHSHGIPSLQRLNCASIACMFPAAGRTAASKSNAVPNGPSQPDEGPNRYRGHPSDGRPLGRCQTLRSSLTTQ
jgi:hypothetical protein